MFFFQIAAVAGWFPDKDWAFSYERIWPPWLFSTRLEFQHFFVFKRARLDSVKRATTLSRMRLLASNCQPPARFVFLSGLVCKTWNAQTIPFWRNMLGGPSQVPWREKVRRIEIARVLDCGFSCDRCERCRE